MLRAKTTTQTKLEGKLGLQRSYYKFRNGFGTEEGMIGCNFKYLDSNASKGIMKGLGKNFKYSDSNIVKGVNWK